jgi:hypothetical protein
LDPRRSGSDFYFVSPHGRRVGFPSRDEKFLMLVHRTETRGQTGRGLSDPKPVLLQGRSVAGVHSAGVLRAAHGGGVAGGVPEPDPVAACGGRPRETAGRLHRLPQEQDRALRLHLVLRRGQETLQFMPSVLIPMSSRTKIGDMLALRPTALSPNKGTRNLHRDRPDDNGTFVDTILDPSQPY